MNAQERLQSELGISGLLAGVLVKRGFTDPAIAHEYLHPSLDRLGDPSLLPDYDAAEREILGAIERKERIYVHGDYDVDGVSSASLLGRFLRLFKADVVVFVPHRLRDGYGLHPGSIHRAAETGAKLLITCDCGTTSHEQVELAHELGMKVVVTDHHALEHTLPRAEAVINPHRNDSRYPFTELCGAGVAFRLCEGLTRAMGNSIPNYRNAFLDLATLGTIADVMPLTGENRIITKFGLEKLYETKKIGLRALFARAEGLKKKTKFVSSDVGFQIGPRLNAPGRIEDANQALELLMTQDDAYAHEVARIIEDINTERKALQDKMVEEACQMVIDQELDKRYVILVASEKWHPGVIGLIAGKIKERFRRPTFALQIDPESGRGRASGRSIEGFDLAALLHGHSHLVAGGGHAMAAGFDVEAGRIDEVYEAFERYAREWLTEEHFRVQRPVDLEISAKDATVRGVKELELMEPFGAGNWEPIFLVPGAELLSVSPTKDGEHAQLMLELGGSKPTRAIAFRQYEHLKDLPAGTTGDLYARINVEEYQGRDFVKWKVEDFVPAELPESAAQA